MINLISGATKKPISSKQLAEFFVNSGDEFDGDLYIGYPIIAAPDGAFPIDALWVSERHGIVIFCLVEGREIGPYATAQDESANRLETKLRGYQELMKGRKLLAEPRVITFAPLLSSKAKRKMATRCVISII
nr:hypothetical protein [uncultured Hyphomonas sp.]